MLHRKRHGGSQIFGDHKIAVVFMASASPAAGFASTSASLQGRDASAGAAEKECEKELFAHRPCGHSLDKIRKTANSGPDQMVCGAHSEPERGAETFSAGRCHPVVPEAMRLEQLDPFSGPSSPWNDVPNPIEWEQVLAHAPDMILADAHELGPVPDQVARGDAQKPFRINFRAISRKDTSCRHAETTELDVETNPAAGERGGTAATLRNRNDDMGTAFEARAIDGSDDGELASHVAGVQMVKPPSAPTGAARAADAPTPPGAPPPSSAGKPPSPPPKTAPTAPEPAPAAVATDATAAATAAATPATKTAASLLEGDGVKRTRHSPAEAPNGGDAPKI